MIGTTSTNSSATATAEAIGQSAVLEELVDEHPADHRVCRRVPSSAGMTYSPVAGMNTSSEPAMMPGSDSGRVTSRNTCQRPRAEIHRRLVERRVEPLERWRRAAGS